MTKFEQKLDLLLQLLGYTMIQPKTKTYFDQ